MDEWKTVKIKVSPSIYLQGPANKIIEFLADIEDCAAVASEYFEEYGFRDDSIYTKDMAIFLRRQRKKLTANMQKE